MYVYSFTGILELDDSDYCVEPTRELRRICNAGVPSGCSSVELEKLAYREESVATAYIQFITPSLPARSVKFVSARFPILQTITRTELYVVSC